MTHDIQEEYLQRISPIVKLLVSLEQYRGWILEVDKDGNQTVKQGDLPPETQHIYDLAMETITAIREAYEPLIASATNK